MDKVFTAILYRYVRTLKTLHRPYHESNGKVSESTNYQINVRVKEEKLNSIYKRVFQ